MKDASALRHDSVMAPVGFQELRFRAEFFKHVRRSRDFAACAGIDRRRRAVIEQLDPEQRLIAAIGREKHNMRISWSLTRASEVDRNFGSASEADNKSAYACAIRSSITFLPNFSCTLGPAAMKRAKRLRMFTATARRLD